MQLRVLLALQPEVLEENQFYSCWNFGWKFVPSWNSGAERQLALIRSCFVIDRRAQLDKNIHQWIKMNHTLMRTHLTCGRSCKNRLDLMQQCHIFTFFLTCVLEMSVKNKTPLSLVKEKTYFVCNEVFFFFFFVAACHY